ncbi:sulfurtransferase complex subunit TusC [Halomonas sp. Bachu 37]|uniref:sulfurtransferase complex subunit TusC n=1 Tax=Halomonas kashgarensis TaxID=3084920 RepID=UPI0032170E4D
MTSSDTADLLMILRHAPYGSSWLREGLDAALVAAAFGQQVSLLFLGEGILSLLSNQAAGAPGQKATAPSIDMLPMYDIETVLVAQEDLARYELTLEDLRLPARACDDEAIQREITRHAEVLTF